MKKIFKNTKTSSLFIILIFVNTLFGCSKDTDIVVKNNDKELITIENLGDIHNYLLAEYEAKGLKTKSSSKTFGDVYNEFENLLINSEKYSTNSTIESGLSELEKQEVLNKFAHIKLDKNFRQEFEKRYFVYFQNLTSIDEEIKMKLLNTVLDLSPIKYSEDMMNQSGYDLVLAYNNVYNSSMDYWSKKGNLKGDEIPENQAIIWADAAGAAIGLGCGGFMSILIGAAASNMIVKCYEMEE